MGNKELNGRGSPNQKSAICQKTPKTSPPVLSYHPWSDIQSHFYNGFLEGKQQEQVKSQRDKGDEVLGEARGGTPAESVHWIQGVLGMREEIS